MPVTRLSAVRHGCSRYATRTPPSIEHTFDPRPTGRVIVHNCVAVTLPEVVGRDEELAAIAAFLDGDLPAALVLAGEAGIGKTTLWRAGLQEARERAMTVLVCRPAESE